MLLNSLLNYVEPLSRSMMIHFVFSIVHVRDTRMNAITQTQQFKLAGMRIGSI